MPSITAFTIASPIYLRHIGTLAHLLSDAFVAAETSLRGALDFALGNVLFHSVINFTCRSHPAVQVGDHVSPSQDQLANAVRCHVEDCHFFNI